MKNNKAFTLIELLSVIILLLVIVSLTTPIVIDVIDRGNETVNENQVSDIISAAYDWSLTNPTLLPDINDTISISLGQLKQEGLVDANIKNSYTKKLFPNDMLISITNIDSENPELEENSKIIGDYLFSVDLDSGTSTEYDPKSPYIVLNGNSVIYVDLNREYEELGYKAYSYSGDNITSEVTTEIIKDENAQSSIDTTTFGIYYINYTVESDNSSITIVRTVVVTDKEKPTLTIPENITLSTDVESYDLKSGAECNDNSACEISISGTVTYKTKGKYIVTYKATDPSGNYTTKKRIVTIK